MEAKFGKVFENETRTELVSHFKNVKNKRTFGEVVAWFVEFWRVAHPEEKEMFSSAFADLSFWEEVVSKDEED